jgi:hypothetical protein
MRSRLVAKIDRSHFEKETEKRRRFGDSLMMPERGIGMFRLVD